jgi:hypothetical protein
MVAAVVAGRLGEARAEGDWRIRQEQVLHDVALDLLAGAPPDDVLRTHLQRVADALGVDAAATVDGTRAIVAGDATPSLLTAELSSARYHSATFGECGRVVIDGGLRLTRAQTQLIDTFAPRVAEAPDPGTDRVRARAGDGVRPRGMHATSACMDGGPTPGHAGREPGRSPASRRKRIRPSSRAS